MCPLHLHTVAALPLKVDKSDFSTTVNGNIDLTANRSIISVAFII